MPIAVVDPQKYERYELKSLPDGYVMLRPLTYGMKLERRTKASRMTMRDEGPQDHKPKGGGSPVVSLETYEDWTVEFDFANCIGDHNLEITEGQKVDFSSRIGWKFLDPRIGSEIEMLIYNLNEGEGEETVEDFTKRLSSSSPDPTPAP